MATESKFVGANYKSKKILQNQSASDRIANKINQRNEDIIRGIAAFDARLAEVHRLFEMYFLGLERRLPDKEREELRKQMAHMRANTQGVKTNILFKLNTTWQRFSSYDQLWGRTLKQIEDGTYRRDVDKAKRRAKKDEQDAAKVAAAAAAAGGSAAPEAAAPSAAARAAAAAAEAVARKPASGSSMSDDDVKRIYDTYVLARKKTGESTKVSMDSLANQLKERAATMSAQHNTDIEFKVVIKAGKALIKAVPKT